MSARSIELQIDELVLVGIPAGDRWRVADALQAGLERRLHAPGLPPTIAGSSDLARVDAGRLDVAPHQSPAALGDAIAGVVFTALGGSSR